MNIKHVEDYYDAVSEKFDWVDKEDIKKILNHGFRSLYRLNANGADVTVVDKFDDKTFICYFGKFTQRQDSST